MKNSKFFLIRVAFSYVLISFVTTLFAIGVWRRVGVFIPYLALLYANTMIALYLGLAISLFKAENWPGWVRIIGGYLFLVISTLTIRRVFGVWLFRRSIVLIIVLTVLALIYAIALMVARQRLLQETRSMNASLEHIDRGNGDE